MDLCQRDERSDCSDSSGAVSHKHDEQSENGAQGLCHRRRERHNRRIVGRPSADALHKSVRPRREVCRRDSSGENRKAEDVLPKRLHAHNLRARRDSLAFQHQRQRRGIQPCDIFIRHNHPGGEPAIHRQQEDDSRSQGALRAERHKSAGVRRLRKTHKRHERHESAHGQGPHQRTHIRHRRKKQPRVLHAVACKQNESREK